MQTNLPFWVIGLFFSAFKVLLVGALGGILSIYAASGSRYGNSIRWSRQGGYLEMASVLRNSSRPVPRLAAVAMIMAIIASLLAHFTSLFFSTMVHRSDINDNQSYTSTKTMRPTTSGEEIDDWLIYLGHTSNVESSLGLLINNTRNIPDAVPGRRYTPRTFGYEVACDSIEVVVAQNLTDPIEQRVGGCSAAMFDIGSDFFVWEPKKAINIQTAPDQYTIIAPASYPNGLDFREHRALSFLHFDYLCLVPLSTIHAQAARQFNSFPNSGMTSLPRTMLTRCQYTSGALNVAAHTQMQFAISSLAEYDNITTTIFDGSAQLPLLTTMSAFTKNGTFLSTQSNSTLVALTKAGADVHFLSCRSLHYIAPDDVGLLCEYQVVVAIMTTPQLEDPIIAADLKGRRVLGPTLPINQNLAGIQGAKYFASLGQNFVMDWETGQLYVLYDTVDIKDGQEFSTALFVVLVVIMVLCAGVWVYSEKTIGVMYTNSLYKLIYTELEPHMEKTAPMLMSCTNDPLAFEGVPLVGVDDVSEESTLQDLAPAGKSSRLSSRSS
ncbi:hypothetical protein BGZ70_005858 [Mortierella alpina]|uniref:Transmembrane protein n=1 Tax=Mortierella alpina TaxID=64518 RepID=A0A9P6M434_MORAP|nr:hypothetical protein BGZ70_005858 [Mortierella alpina]